MISLCIIFFLFFLGFFKPSYIGYKLFVISPFMVGVSNLIIYKDILLPIRWEQFLFAFSLGLALSKEYRKRLKKVFLNIKPIFLFIVYILMSIIYGFLDPHEILFKWFFLQEYPLYLSIIILSFSFIKSYEDIEKFKNVLTYTLILIVLLILIEMITKFNLSNYLCFINKGYCDLNALHFNYITDSYTFSTSDAAIRRYAGHTGDPNTSAIILAMFSIVILHSLILSEKFFSTIIIGGFFLCCILILIIGQTRAAIFSFLVVLFFYAVFRYKVLKYLIFIGILLLVFYLTFGSLNRYINLFIENRITQGNLEIDSQRIQGLIMSLEVFKESLGMGVGGTIYSVSEKYLDFNDTSGYILHFLVGGIPFGIMYLIFLGSMIYDLFKIKYKVKLKEHFIFIEVVILALLIGMISQVFNENSLIFYYLLLYSTVRASLFNISLNNEKKG